MTHSLADLMLSQLNTAASPLHIDKPPDSPAPVDTTPTTQYLDCPLAQPDVVVKRIPLSALRIDHHQPRNYLPQDLRAELVHHGDARGVLQSLIARVAQNDPIAAGYLDSIRTLARSIAEVGLQQPIRVAVEDAGAYRIVDGERRFWAFLFLCETAGNERYDSIEAMLHDPAASADDVQRAQWAANLCREDIPVVDFADTVSQIREQFHSRLLLKSANYIAELGDAAKDKTKQELALLLTQREVERLTGRALSDRHLYSNLAIADRLKPKAKELARTYQLSLRQLAGLVRLPEDEQVQLILRMARVSPYVVAQNEDEAAMRSGRPTSLQRGINACVTLKTVLQKLTELNMARQSPADVQVLLNELDAAAQHIERARRLAQSRLS